MNKKNVLYLIFIVFITIMAFFISYYYYSFTRYKKIEISSSNEQLGISEEVDGNDSTSVASDISSSSYKEKKVDVLKNQEIINIALFGLDRRNAKQTSRSDAIMILSIDNKHNKIKLSSLMRDMFVDIDGYKSQKLNHAYALGGAELAIKTINQNFGTDIRHFGSIDFFALEEVIDLLGGIELPVKKSEINNINKYIKEVAYISKKKPDLITEEGDQVLSGIQAVAYARIRSVGGGDFERTERQRRVITALVNKAEDVSVFKMADLVIEILPYIETNLSQSEILNLAYIYAKNRPMDLEQGRFPLDGDFKSDMSTGTYYIRANKDKTKASIRNFIYEEEDIHEEMEIEVGDSQINGITSMEKDVDNKKDYVEYCIIK